VSSEQYHSYITITRLTRMCIWASILIDQITMEEFEDTKGAIRIIRISKNRQHNGQMKKYKRTNNDLQKKYKKLKIE
jgi:hypothetical protein